nr:IS66 family transposase [Polymorphobacter sp. PAMC 29334]
MGGRAAAGSALLVQPGPQGRAARRTPERLCRLYPRRRLCRLYPRRRLCRLRGADPVEGPAWTTGQRIVHAACWAHARRKLYDVHQKTQSPIAFEGLRRIGVLYDIEREINGLPHDRRHAIRAERTVPLLADLRVWMGTERRRLSSKNDLAKALQYALGRWDALAWFTADGRLAIDNNVAERALRGIAVTRKNFLFLGSEKGGDRAAIIYTALETARLNGIDPEAWLTDVLNQLARGQSQLDLDPLMPWNWRKPAPLAIAA